MMPGYYCSHESNGYNRFRFSAFDEQRCPIMLRPDFRYVNMFHHDEATIAMYKYHLLSRELKANSLLRKHITRELQQSTFHEDILSFAPERLLKHKIEKKMTCEDKELAEQNLEDLLIFTYFEPMRLATPPFELVYYYIGDELAPRICYRSEWHDIFAQDIALWKHATQYEIESCDHASSNVQCKYCCNPLTFYVRSPKLEVSLIMVNGTWYISLKANELVFRYGFPCPCQHTGIMLDEFIAVFQNCPRKNLK